MVFVVYLVSEPFDPSFPILKRNVSRKNTLETIKLVPLRWSLKSGPKNFWGYDGVDVVVIVALIDSSENISSSGSEEIIDY